MSVLPPQFPPAGSAGGLSASATSMQWAALNEAGNVVATLAGLSPERPNPAIRNFPALMRDCEGWRRALADNGVADLSAMMEPGIAALLAVNARGVSTAAPALALWREFNAARAAILALLPPAGALGPRRSA